MRTSRLRELTTYAAAGLLAMSLMCSTACSFSFGTSSSANDDSSSQAQGDATQSDSGSNSDGYDRALAGNGLVSTFLGEKFYDKKVTNEDEALAALESAKDRIGADDTTKYEFNSTFEDGDNKTYYVFQQKVGDIVAHGATAKVITNKDGEAIALVSAVMPKVTVADKEQWQVTAEDAEKAVLNQCESEGIKNAEVIKGATEQTLIPLEGAKEQYRYAWVVYTNKLDETSDMNYLAHYVNADGEYLHSMPVAEPNNAEALAGEQASFPFDKFKQDKRDFTVTLHDGSTKKVSVPVLVDEQANQTYLADGERKILCADYPTLINDDKIEPQVSSDDTFNNVDVLAYDTYIRVWDFYNQLGWKGPDGSGTPTVLLMNYVDENQEPSDEAYYMGRLAGYHAFSFNRVNPDGENLDIVGHEFTHGVTVTSMTSSIYRNEQGAINEGMSDVLGNIIKMINEDNPDQTWLLGSGSGKTLRSMKDPHEHEQPEYKWDQYYVPAVQEGTDINDNGGVHTNSSLLNYVSYKLDQAGMKPDEQFNFWIEVAFALTPCTDYPQLAQLLPWCLEQSGYGSYKDALNKAIEEGKYTYTETPTEPTGESGLIRFVYPDAKVAQSGNVVINIVSAEDSNKVMATWPAAETNAVTAMVAEGDYMVLAKVRSDQEQKFYVATSTGWEQVDSLADGYEKKENKVHVNKGQTVELPTEGL